MHKFLLFGVALLLIAAPVMAQEDAPIYPSPVAVAEGVDISLDADNLALENDFVFSEEDVFGQTVQLLEGDLVNTGDEAYTNITIFADLLDADGTFIGEGIGFVVDRCGVGLASDFALQPGASQHIRLTLEPFEADAQIAAVTVIPEANAIDALPQQDAAQVEITPVLRDEVVDVERIDATTLRYAVGCDTDTFTYHMWYEYDLTSGESTPLDQHPKAEIITERFIDSLRIESEDEFRDSFIDFAPVSERVVFQSSVNHFYVANADGTARQFIWDNISRISLQGIQWQDGDVFMAYYFGAYGEEVLYFTASARSGRISRSVYIVAPSDIIPAMNTFGTYVVLATTFDGITGYWYRHVFLTDRRLLFEADPPGNNWPAPIYEDQLMPDPLIYITRPVDGEARLQCFNMDTDELIDLTAIPLDLTIADRGWMWLSPEGTHIALASNGLAGGLWIIDLAQLPDCLPAAA